jgi:hypothetical protein
MSTLRIVGSLLLTLAVVGSVAAADPPDHGIFPPDAVTWQDGPPSLAKGARFAVLEGDPTKEGLFTMRLRLPDGFKIMPHWHPAVEHVTVVAGIFHVGMGDQFDAAMAGGLPTGTFAFLAPKMHHFAWAEGDTIIQLHGVGPWQINYLDPANDPRLQKKP